MNRFLSLFMLSVMAFTTLAGCKEKDYFCDGQDICIAGNTVYIVGSVCQGTSLTDVPTLWINGEPQSVGQMGNFNTATSVFVDNDDVYVTINEKDQGKSLLWKNGKLQHLGNQNANSVVAKNGVTYVVGQDNGRPTLWINGNPEYLSYEEGTAESICMDGEDIYVVGYTGNIFIGKAKLWKNGIEEALSDKTSAAYDIVITGNDIYISGEENNNATLWINGESQCLSYDKSSAYSVAVSGETVFVTGISGFDSKGSPKYGIWRNGALMEISDDMRDQIMSVKISNDKVYFSGSSKNKVPLWTINL
ncbi:MAG: hypothetical protein NC308_05945 [Clostridium sp.]|nr:hypothetical protein [Bacteroides sp.]MCM1198411.1 hypothetical protein [Clostridium sp.]